MSSPMRYVVLQHASDNSTRTGPLVCADATPQNRTLNITARNLRMGVTIRRRYPLGGKSSAEVSSLIRGYDEVPSARVATVNRTQAPI